MIMNFNIISKYYKSKHHSTIITFAYYALYMNSYASTLCELYIHRDILLMFIKKDRQNPL